MTGDPVDEARALAASLREVLDWARAVGAGESERNELTDLILGFAPAAAEHSVVTRSLPPFEQVNLQTALDAWSAEPGREVTVHGLTIPPHHGGVNLQQIVAGEAMHRVSLAAPQLADLPNGPDSTLGCLQRALLLVEDAHGRYVVMVSGPVEHEPGLEVSIAGLQVDAAQAVHDRLAQLRRELNVYRGHVLDVELTPTGVMLVFGEVPSTVREDVILPEPVLSRVERHALGVAEHRVALLAAGQHLKRGLLLYGPPGTGKTHTTSYLVAHMRAYTRLVLTGRSLHAIGSIAGMARELEPAVIVLEDVDLVAEDRSFGPGGSSVLFDLLDAMDGAAPDSDLLFLLTTNRADLLEPALAARPGRVDVAVEIDLPDEQARRRLLALYGRSARMALTDEETATVIARTEGVTASFLKELVRRAVLESLATVTSATGANQGSTETSDPVTGARVTGAHVARALDDLLDGGQQLTRNLLGVGNDPESVPPGGGAGSLPHPRGRHVLRGWS